MARNQRCQCVDHDDELCILSPVAYCPKCARYLCSECLSFVADGSRYYCYSCGIDEAQVEKAERDSGG